MTTIAADGRRSTLAFGLGLVRHPVRPRRWAIGAYLEGVEAGTRATAERLGHLSARCTFGADVTSASAPMTDDRTNVCLVKPSGAGDGAFGDPEALLRGEIERDPLLADRFRRARLVRPPAVLGPLAVDAGDTSIDGLLLAGDASGFVDPMTGDGLRFAIVHGELAALAALDAHRARLARCPREASRRAPARVRLEVALQPCPPRDRRITARGALGRGRRARLSRAVCVRAIVAPATGHCSNCGQWLR